MDGGNTWAWGRLKWCRTSGTHTPVILHNGNILSSPPRTLFEPPVPIIPPQSHTAPSLSCYYCLGHYLMHIPSLGCARLVLPARQWAPRDENHVPQIPVASRLSMEPDTGGAGKHTGAQLSCDVKRTCCRSVVDWQPLGAAPLDHTLFPPMPHFCGATAGQWLGMAGP